MAFGRDERSIRALSFEQSVGSAGCSKANVDRSDRLIESEAEAAQQKDIDPTPHFTLADRLRAKSNLMVGMLIIMAGALWFYTMAGEIKHPIRYGLAALGVICMLMGMIGAISIKVIS